MLEFLVLWLAFSSIGSVLAWREVIVLWCIIVVFLFIPWLPGSLGLVEFGAASTLVVLGFSGSTAASGILISRLISFWLVLFVGLVALYYSKKKGELPKNIKLRDVHEKSFNVGNLNKANK